MTIPMEHKQVAISLVQVLELMTPKNARKVVDLVCSDLYGFGLIQSTVFSGQITHEGEVWAELTKLSDKLEDAGEPAIEAYFWSQEQQ